jgi:hypothetical protein
LRDEPLTIRTRDGDFAFFCLRSAASMSARLDPFDRQIEFRIGIAGAGFPRPRGLVVFVIGDPSGVDDFVELAAQRRIIGIVESRQEAPLELRLVERNARHALAHFDLAVGVGHGVPRCSGP